MNKQNSKAIYPILFGFFVMGFADVVGIATNYVKVDFSLSDTLANLIPMMVFLWFALFSIPTGVMMGKLGRRNTVVIALAVTALAMLLPLFFYDFACILLAFALLGIGNTILQVSLNPMVANVVSPDRITSVLIYRIPVPGDPFYCRYRCRLEHYYPQVADGTDRHARFRSRTGYQPLFCRPYDWFVCRSFPAGETLRCPLPEI